MSYTHSVPWIQIQSWSMETEDICFENIFSSLEGYFIIIICISIILVYLWILLQHII